MGLQALSEHHGEPGVLGNPGGDLRGSRRTSGAQHQTNRYMVRWFFPVKWASHNEAVRGTIQELGSIGIDVDLIQTTCRNDLPATHSSMSGK
eukprot:207180-Pyramimonas_sp.AAC.1